MDGLISGGAIPMTSQITCNIHYSLAFALSNSLIYGENYSKMSNLNRHGVENRVAYL